MTKTEPQAQQNPVSPDGLLRWNGHNWEPNLVEESDFGPEKLTTLTEAERHQLENSVRPETLGWYADPLSDGSTARLWSGSEWTGIVRRRLESATSASDPSEPTVSSTAPRLATDKGPSWSTKKKLITASASVIFVLIGLVAVGTANSGSGTSSKSVVETTSPATSSDPPRTGSLQDEEDYLDELGKAGIGVSMSADLDAGYHVCHMTRSSDSTVPAYDALTSGGFSDAKARNMIMASWNLCPELR